MLLKACYDSVCYERMCYEMACYERMFYKKVCYKRVCHGTYGMNGKRCVCVWGGGGMTGCHGTYPIKGEWLPSGAASAHTKLDESHPDSQSKKMVGMA